MVLYSYKCDNCQHTIDMEFNMGKALNTVMCSVCGGVMKRDFSSIGITIPSFFHDSTYNYDTSPSGSSGSRKRFSMKNNPLKN